MNCVVLHIVLAAMYQHTGRTLTRTWIKIIKTTPCYFSSLKQREAPQQRAIKKLTSISAEAAEPSDLEDIAVLATSKGRSYRHTASALPCVHVRSCVWVFPCKKANCVFVSSASRSNLLMRPLHTIKWADIPAAYEPVHHMLAVNELVQSDTHLLSERVKLTLVACQVDASSSFKS